jgi:ribosome-associated toxin RatA of RatAB toxin-antitoxin module
MTVRLSLTFVALVGATIVAVAAPQEPSISVVKTGGAFVVAAHFNVSAPPSVVRDVLTDYANIPRFMPSVRTSRVVDRQEAIVRVEQEAVSTYMMFSKRFHLLLDVEEGTDMIQFRDVCTSSFARYEGTWTIIADGSDTELSYKLIAEPAFSVPTFVLRKLLDRDARAMIEGLRSEISTRSGK